MNIVLYIFVAILALSFIVFIHELGHFSAAKFFGVKVERFSIGFGKPFYKKYWRGTEWVFAPILLGGYVQMKGQDDSNPLAKNSDPDSYTSKKPWQRIVILAAGPIANIVLAFFIYLAIAINGAPISTASSYLPPVVGKVMPNSPANKAGIKENDKILKVASSKIEYWYEIGEAIQKAKEPIAIEIKRGEDILNLELKSNIEDRRNEFNETIKRKIIGIAPKVTKGQIINFSLAGALKYAFNETKKSTLLITKGIQKVSTGEVDSKNIGGAITIFDIIIQFAKNGFIYLIFIMALISVNLGVLNLLPIPALDGGHIMFNLYELITKKELNEKVYYYLTLAGWAFLIFIMVFGMYNDVNRLWGAK